jgi:hypothetical protein
MTLKAIYAHVSCSDLARSTTWFTSIFEREPDAKPMNGLAEWHHGETAGLQLFENTANSGKSTLTLIVADIRGEHARLAKAGLRPGEIETADYTTIFRLRDPDNNLVVLAQPKAH